jgi:hypothetical protein
MSTPEPEKKKKDGIAVVVCRDSYHHGSIYNTITLNGQRVERETTCTDLLNEFYANRYDVVTQNTHTSDKRYFTERSWTLQRQRK